MARCLNCGGTGVMMLGTIETPCSNCNGLGIVTDGLFADDRIEAGARALYAYDNRGYGGDASWDSRSDQLKRAYRAKFRTGLSAAVDVAEGG